MAAARRDLGTSRFPPNMIVLPTHPTEVEYRPQKRAHILMRIAAELNKDTPPGRRGERVRRTKDEHSYAERAVLHAPGLRLPWPVRAWRGTPKGDALSEESIPLYPGLDEMLKEQEERTRHFTGNVR